MKRKLLAAVLAVLAASQLTACRKFLDTPAIYIEEAPCFKEESNGTTPPAESVGSPTAETAEEQDETRDEERPPSEGESEQKAPDTESYLVLLKVPAVSQFPTLPTGCEATAAAMALQYLGEDVSAEEFAAGWLECDGNFYTAGGKSYGPDPNKVFAGNPFNSYSYGCYAPPIAKAINENSTLCRAEVVRNKPLERLCAEYTDKGVPVLIWATMGMKESTVGNSWILPDGTSFTWIGGEHCLVLVGYDEGFYYLNDPQSGSTVAYQRHVAEQRYRELDMQAVVIQRK